MIAATATVVTDSPARYAKQLASHLGHRAEVRAEGPGDRVVIGTGSCLLEPRDGALVLHAVADDAEGLARVEQVVGSHLERFGRRDELTVTWVVGG